MAQVGKCNVSGTDSAGAQLVHRAAMGGNGAIFQALVDLGSDEAALTSSGRTTLHYAALGEVTQHKSAVYKLLHIVFLMRSLSSSSVGSPLAVTSAVRLLCLLPWSSATFACVSGAERMSQLRCFLEQVGMWRWPIGCSSAVLQ